MRNLGAVRGESRVTGPRTGQPIRAPSEGVSDWLRRLAASKVGEYKGYAATTYPIVDVVSYGAHSDIATRHISYIMSTMACECAKFTSTRPVSPHNARSALSAADH